MKKSLIITLVLVFVLGIAGTAFAANPFVDVPAKHWAYDAVAKLQKAGIVDGYSDGAFKGEKTMSRYEMAIVVARAMAKEDKANAENKAIIDKLAAEFKAELDNLGVRVSALEAKADKINFTGFIRANYQKEDVDGTSIAENQNRFYLALEGIYKVNDVWSAHIYNETSEYYGSQHGSNTDGTGTDPVWKRIWVSGKVGNVGVDFGKKWYCYGYNTVVGIEGKGANFNFSTPSLTTDVFYFKPSWGNNASDGTASGTNMYGVHFAAPVAKNTNVNLLVGGNSKTDATVMSSWGEVGFDTKFAQDFKFTASYGKTNANTMNHNLNFRLDYKGADQNVPHSYGLYVRFMDRQLNGDACGDTEDDSFNHGVKNLGFGVDYTVAKNIVWGNLFVHTKNTDTTSPDNGKSGKLFRTRLDFHF